MKTQSPSLSLLLALFTSCFAFAGVKQTTTHELALQEHLASMAAQKQFQMPGLSPDEELAVIASLYWIAGRPVTPSLEQKLVAREVLQVFYQNARESCNNKAFLKSQVTKGVTFEAVKAAWQLRLEALEYALKKLPTPTPPLHEARVFFI